MKSANINFIPFSSPEIDDDEISSVIRTMRSGWLTTGPNVLKFEKNFSSYLGCDLESIAVNSATAGLHLALEALGIGPGDEVITTTHTFTATAEVIRYLGAHPVFVDIKKDTLCIDVDAFEQAISSRTKAVIPVHFGGLAVDMPRLLDIAHRYGLKVIEDAAHALPATSNGKLVGSLESDVTVFSFYANKTMTTGEGGMLVTRNSEIAKRVKVMRLHGINRDVFDRFTSKVPSWYYEIVAPGFKYNMTDIAAAMGIPQLKKVGDFQRRRQQISERYHTELNTLPIKLPAKAPNGDIHAWHLYVIRLNDDAPVSRDIFIERMFEMGIGCSVHYIPLHLHPYWRDSYKLTSDMFPVSHKAYKQSISLPIYSKMTDDDVDTVIATVKTILQ